MAKVSYRALPIGPMPGLEPCKRVLQARRGDPGRRALTCRAFAALVSRQFVDMTRIRIEGLLAAFPKLVGSGKQHTYIETENVRYVYQPLEVHFRPPLLSNLAELTCDHLRHSVSCPLITVLDGHSLQSGPQPCMIGGTGAL